MGLLLTSPCYNFHPVTACFCPTPPDGIPQLPERHSGLAVRGPAFNSAKSLVNPAHLETTGRPFGFPETPGDQYGGGRAAQCRDRQAQTRNLRKSNGCALAPR